MLSRTWIAAGLLAASPLVHAQDVAPAIAETCAVDMVWGHGEEVGPALRETRQYSPHAVGQGCYLQNGSRLGTAIYQPGYNGHWMGTLSVNYNGGMNPVLSALNPVSPGERAVLAQGNLERDIGFDEEYNDRETTAIELTLGRMAAPPELQTIIESINAVGFMRMSQYHWSAVMKKSGELIRSGRCEQVEVRFNCQQSPLYLDIHGENWSNRLQLAAGRFYDNASDRRMLRDRNGRPIYLAPRNCGMDSNLRMIKSIPTQCGTSHTLDRESVERLMRGACSTLYQKVTDRYSTPGGWAAALSEVYWD